MKPHPRPTRLPLLACGLLLAGALAPLRADPAYTFKRGVNISHWVSQIDRNDAFAAPWFGQSDLDWIAAQGFDHVRLPVDIRLCLKPDGSLDPARLEPIDRVIHWARARGLGSVFDAHFLPGADFNSVGGDRRAYTDEAIQVKDAELWAALARHYAAEGPYLRFEILNEPVAAENHQLNPFMHRMLAAIRESNPTRIVYVTSNRWSSFHTVPDVVLPDDPNIALTIHFYEPIVFTHQRAPWVGFTDDLPPVRFPGVVPEIAGHTRPHFSEHLRDVHPGEPITAAQIDATFASVASWVARTRPGIEVYVGEFGVYQAADPDSARRWIATVRGNAEQRGWGWAVWEYEGSFGVRRPDGSGTAILEGLFPKNSP